MSRTLWNCVRVIPAMLGAALVIFSGVLGGFAPGFVRATETLKAPKESKAQTVDSLVSGTTPVVATVSKPDLEEPGVTNRKALTTVTMSEGMPALEDIEAPTEDVLSEHGSQRAAPLTTGVADQTREGVVTTHRWRRLGVNGVDGEGEHPVFAKIHSQAVSLGLQKQSLPTQRHIKSSQVAYPSLPRGTLREQDASPTGTPSANVCVAANLVVRGFACTGMHPEEVSTPTASNPPTPPTSTKRSLITTPVAETPPEVLADSSPTLAPMPTDASVLKQIDNYTNESHTDDTIDQVTNVTQLQDVSPSDWAFEALRSLVERYGCIAGYPDSTYRGNRSLSRYEFAAGLNACLQQVERLIRTRGEGLATKEDLATIQRLTEEFGPELAALRGKVDALETRTNGLEATGFSTTTKLNGEVIFGVAGIVSGDDIFGDRVDNVTILGSRTRLNLDTSFTGRDLLRTRLQALSLDNFTSRTQTYEGNLAFANEDGNANNNVEIDTLLYQFPIGKSTEVVIVANGGEADDFASTVNFLDGDGGFGALTRFGTRNPIYYLVEGSGIGIRQKLGSSLELSLGYLAGDNRNTANPDRGGLFNGPYGAMAQLVYKPSSRFQIGLTYINSYNRETLTGSPLSNPQTFIRNLANQRVNVNFQPAAPSATPITFPANQPISAGTTLPSGITLPAGTTLVDATTLPFDITIPRPRGTGTITIRAGTTIPAGTTLPINVTLPIDFTLPAAITLPVDLTLPAATTPPPAPIVFNGTLGQLLSQPQFAGIPLGFDLNIPIVSNSYGLELSWQIGNHFVLGGWVGYTTTTPLSTGNGLFSTGNINTINGAVTLAFPDLGGRGNLGGIVVGVEPFVLNTDIRVNQNLVNPSSLNPALIPVAIALANSTPIGQIIKLFDNPDPDVSLHIEAFYQYRLTDNIFITPGVIVITTPGSNANNADLVIGTLRTTFTF